MGEYEPNDSRNVTGANNQMSQNEGNPNTQQGGQHWQDASISQSPQQGHGQDPGMRGQQQQQQSGGSGGQMGGSQSGGQAQQFDSSSGGSQMGGGQSGLRGQLREHMEVIGADGVHVGTIDAIEGDRIKLTKRDSGAGYEGGQHTGHHHYLPLGLVAEVEGDKVRLSANGDVAYGMEQEEGEG